MFIFINGSFGVGKTTISRALRRRLAGAAIFDPEPVGVLLQHLPSFIPLSGSRTDDFQDMPLWRRSIVFGLGVYRRLYAHTIVPMTFSNRAYFDSIVADARLLEPNIRCFCLTAPLALIQQRLVQRGVSPHGKGGEWIFRRASECVQTFGDGGGFGELISTKDRSVPDIVNDILDRLAPT